jgi:surface protein
MSISKEIERIQQAKKDIGDAIVRKGGSVSGTIDTYAKSVMALGDVSFRTAIDIVNKSDAKNVDLTMISPKNETSLRDLFYGNTNLIHINATNWDTSNITSLRSTFGRMENIESVDLSDWNVSNVTTFYALFDACSHLKTIDVSKWNTSSATSMGWMFNRTDLNTLDVSNFNTSNVTDMFAMFSSSRSLTRLDISNFNTSKVLDLSRSFSYWDNVCEELNISGLNLTRVTSINNAFYATNFKVIRSDGLRFPNIDMSKIGLANSTALTVDSIVGLLNALPQSDKGYSFQIGSNNIAKLSDEQKAIATDKGWTLI